MDYQIKIESLMDEYNGFLLTEAVTKADIPRAYIKEFLDQGKITKLERGVYLRKNGKDDVLFRTQLKYKGIIYSHETAMRLHGFLKKVPDDTVSVTVKTGINPTKLKDRGLKVYTIKEDMMDVGLVSVKTKFGNSVKTYSLERTICDILRSRNSINDAVFGAALNEYIRSPKYDEEALVEMAQMFHVGKILSNYKKVII